MPQEKPKKKKDGQRSIHPAVFVVGGIVSAAFVTVVILAMLGPTVGNIFSNVVTGLNAGSGSNTAYIASAPSNEVLQSRSNQAPLPTANAVANAPVVAPQALSFSESDDVVGLSFDDASSDGLMTGDIAGDVDIETETTEEIPLEETLDEPNVADYGVNPFVETAQDNLSTFAMDVDTASYTMARNYLLNYGQMPPPNAIRPEEFINYYPAGYAPPTDIEFGIYLDAAPSPFNADTVLFRAGLQGQAIPPAERDPALLVFVIDVSGSMSSENRLPLVKQSLALLVDALREDDRVAIVVYSDDTRAILAPTPASDKDRIMQVINQLQTEGSTNAEAGLRLGYTLAESHMREGEITRVLLLSDGVANVGITDSGGLLGRIQQSVDSGITLSTLGFGMGDFNDVLMERLANDGDGNYYYIDDLREAQRIFQYNLASTLQVIAYDAKIQVDFNPETVAEYRLIGYENRDVADEDFRDDTVDAGEVGAGHSVTAIYEVRLHEQAQSGQLATVYIRYQDAQREYALETNRTLNVDAIAARFEDAPRNFRVQVAIAEFADLLRRSPYTTSNYGDVIRIMQPFEQDNAITSEVMAMMRAAQRYAAAQQ